MLFKELNASTKFEELRLLHESAVPGFNDRMKERLLLHLGKIANKKDYVSNTTFSLLYTLINNNKIDIQFFAKLGNISEFWAIENNLGSSAEVVGGYNFTRRKIEIYVYWPFNSNFVINYISEKTVGKLTKAAKGNINSDNDSDDAITSSNYYRHLNNICNKLFAIIMSEALLIYDYKHKGELSNHQLVKKWYNCYFTNVMNDTLNHISISSKLYKHISETYGGAIYEKVEKNLVEGREIGVKTKYINKSDDLNLDGIPTIQMGRSKKIDVFQDILNDIVVSNKVNVGIIDDAVKYIYKFNGEFAEFAHFMYDNRDRRFDIQNLAASPESDKDEGYYKKSVIDNATKVAKRNDRAIERKKEESDRRERDLDFLYKTNVLDDPRIIKTLNHKEKEELKKLDRGTLENNLKKLGDGTGAKLEPKDTYISKYLLNKDITIDDLEFAYNATIRAIQQAEAFSNEFDRIINNSSKVSDEKLKECSNINAQIYAQAKAYVSSFYQLVRQKTRRQDGTYFKDIDLGESPSYDQIKSIIPRIKNLIDEERVNMRNSLTALSSFSNDKDVIKSRLKDDDDNEVPIYIRDDNKRIKDRMITSVKDNTSNVIKSLRALSDKIKTQGMTQENKKLAVTLITNLSDSLKKLDVGAQRLDDIPNIARIDANVIDNMFSILNSNDYIKYQNLYSKTPRSIINETVSINDKGNIWAFIEQFIAPQTIKDLIFANMNIEYILSNKLTNIINAASEHNIGYDGRNKLNQLISLIKTMPLRATGKQGIIKYFYDKYISYFKHNNNHQTAKRLLIKDISEIYYKSSEILRIKRDIELNYARALIRQFPKALKINKVNEKDLRNLSPDRINKILNTIKRQKETYISQYNKQIRSNMMNQGFNISRLPDINNINLDDANKVIDVISRYIESSVMIIDAEMQMHNLSHNKYFNCTVRRQINNEETYYKLLYAKQLYFLLKNKMIPKFFRNIKYVYNKLIEISKDVISTVNIMRPQTQSEFYHKYIRGKKFGFEQMGDSDYFDLAYYEVFGINKMYKNYKGTIRNNFVYNEIYMPVAILMKALFAMLTSGEALDANFVFLINCANKGLEEGYLR